MDDIKQYFKNLESPRISFDYKIKMIMEKRMRELLFEQNNRLLRLEWKTNVLMDLTKTGHGGRCLVICEESNNPPIVVDNNDMVGKVIFTDFDGEIYEIEVKASDMNNETIQKGEKE